MTTHLVLIIMVTTILLILSAKFFFPDHVNYLLTGDYHTNDENYSLEMNTQNLLDNLPTGVFVLDESYQVIYCNEEFSEMVDQSHQKLFHERLDSIFDITFDEADYLERTFEQLHDDFVQTQDSVSTTFRLHYVDSKKNKLSIQILASCVPMVDGAIYPCIIPGRPEPRHGLREVKKQAL